MDTNELPHLNEAFNEQHNLDTTNETIKLLLADGTPDWLSHPDHYKHFAREWKQAEKEQSNALAAQYKTPDQDILSHVQSRTIHPMATRDFIKKLRDNGVQCFTVQVQPGPTVGLWAKSKFNSKPIYIAYCQIPAMFEWSVLRLDEHELGNGESYRGWRTVLCQLIIKEILTEQEAHRIFGEPSGVASVVYKRSLFNFRNGIGRDRPPDTLFEL